MSAARLLLAACLVLGAAAPVRAAQALPVDLRTDLAARLKAEKQLKALLDEWALTAFDVTFTARPAADLAAPDRVRIYLDGFTIAFAPAWYARYKAFVDDLVKQPWGHEAIAHGLTYMRTGPNQLVGTLLDGAGKPLAAATIFRTRAPGGWPPIEQTLFKDDGDRPLPERPPTLDQSWYRHGREPVWLDVPPAAAKAAKKLRVGAVPGGRWPVELKDPLATPVKPPTPPKATGTPLPVPSGAAPALPPPNLAPEPRPSAATSAAPPARRPARCSR